METASSPKKRELDYFNALGCLLVILIHVLSLGITSLDPASWQYAVVFIPHQFSAYVVPAFLFCGAVKMGQASYAESRYFPYILRRIRKVYIPYVVYTLVYFLVFLPIGYVPRSFSALAQYLLTGTISSQFYYIIIVMQFYLLMPLWRWLARRVPWYTGILLSLFVTLLMTKADSVLARFGLSFAYFDRVFPTYLLFWTAGLYAGRHYDGVRKALKAHRAAALSLLVIPALFIFIFYMSRSRGIWIYDLSVLKLFSDLATIAVMLCLCVWLEDSHCARTKRLLTQIHASSLSVFMSHALFLTLATVALGKLGVTKLSLLLLARAAVCYTLPFLLAWLLRRLRALFRRDGRRAS